MVEMKNPGVWILGTPKDDDRRDGMGIVVEYANKTGQPRWIKPAKGVWDYTLFGDNRTAAAPDEVIPIVIGKINGGTGGFNQWTLKPGESKQWPVVFVIDPKLPKDVSTITLSYTFFEVGGKVPAAPKGSV